MSFLFAAKYRYYYGPDSAAIIDNLNHTIPRKITKCEHGMACIFKDMIETEPCCYWNRIVFDEVETGLQKLLSDNLDITVEDDQFELFIAGYNAYVQVTKVIQDLSAVNDSPAIKNRQYRIPTYISIVEGCLTNLFHFITLLLNQASEKDYASTYKLKPLCEILEKNGFKSLTEHVDINVRNAINHGGIVFKEDGQLIDFRYTERNRSIVRTLNVYEFDQLINDVYDTASALVLGISVILNNNWNIVHVDKSKKSFAAFSLLGMELSIPQVRCRYISEAPNGTQLNAEFWVQNTDRTYIMQTAIELAILIYSQYNDYEKYYISFSNERLATSWLRFTNQEVNDMVNNKRELSVVLSDAIQKKEVLVFNPSTVEVDLQEIKYFRFPNYQCSDYKINQIEDASLDDRKRLKCRLYIGDTTEKAEILEIIRKSIEWLKTVKNVDSPTIHRKNGTMEADALYINVYRYDARKNKELLPSNENFVCFVDYNASGKTTLVNGGLPRKIWSQFHHEKVGQIDIAWREGKYTIRSVRKIGANELCPCGSGLKFKKCCRGKGIYD